MGYTTPWIGTLIECIGYESDGTVCIERATNGVLCDECQTSDSRRKARAIHAAKRQSTSDR